MATITWQTEWSEDDKTYVMAETLQCKPAQLARHLLALYSWAVDATDDGMMTPFTDSEIARGALWEGDAYLFRSALEESGWIADHYFRLYGWHEIVTLQPGGRLPLEEWNLIRKKILRRDKGICHYCGRRYRRMHIDHVVPVIDGGTNERSNLVTSCIRCNLRKGKKSYQQFKREIYQGLHNED